jgi:hypothetical protein
MYPSLRVPTPHFQLPASVMAEEREKIRFEFLTHTLDTHGRFGCAEERIWPCTIGMNEKGGMSDNEVEKYIDNSIIPLTPGKRVLVKVDSGPGRNGRELLVKCRFRGLYIYPGLPNATSVQQETDLNYGPFKSVTSCFLLHIVSFLCILIVQRRRPSRRDAVVTNVSISLRLEMGPVHATKGELRQTASRTASRQCVEANGAGAVASNDGKRTNDGVF